MVGHAFWECFYLMLGWCCLTDSEMASPTALKAKFWFSKQCNLAPPSSLQTSVNGSPVRWCPFPDCFPPPANSCPLRVCPESSRSIAKLPSLRLSPEPFHFPSLPPELFPPLTHWAGWCSGQEQEARAGYLQYLIQTHIALSHISLCHPPRDERSACHFPSHSSHVLPWETGF